MDVFHFTNVNTDVKNCRSHYFAISNKRFSDDFSSFSSDSRIIFSLAFWNWIYWSLNTIAEKIRFLWLSELSEFCEWKQWNRTNTSPRSNEQWVFGCLNSLSVHVGNLIWIFAYGKRANRTPSSLRLCFSLVLLMEKRTENNFGHSARKYAKWKYVDKLFSVKRSKYLDQQPKHDAYLLDMNII